MKGVQCYELFGGIALKIHTFSLLCIPLMLNCVKRLHLPNIQFYKSPKAFNATFCLVTTSMHTIILINISKYINNIKKSFTRHEKYCPEKTKNS